MLMNTGNDYYRVKEVEQFKFYQVPQLLVNHEYYVDKGLSANAILLYSMLRDRMCLSSMNGWVDDIGRVYIIFTLKHVQEKMRVGVGTSVKLMNELESIGLIEKKRRPNKPAIIYVKNFVPPTANIDQERVKEIDIHNDILNNDNNISDCNLSDVNYDNQLNEKIETNHSQNKNASLEVTEPINNISNAFDTSQSLDKAGLPFFESPDFQKMEENYTNKNNTNTNNTSSSLYSREVEENRTRDDKNDKERNDEIMNKISKDCMERLYSKYDKECINSIYKSLERIMNKIKINKNNKIKIRGKMVSYEIVYAKILKNINDKVFEEVIDILMNYGSFNIHNLDNYILVCFYSYKDNVMFNNSKKSRNSFNNFESNNYDFCELEKSLLYSL